MNGVVFGFEFMCGVVAFVFAVILILRWFSRERRPSARLSLRDWVWLSPVLLVVAYFVVLILGLGK
jgi:hypothetical protein